MSFEIHFHLRDRDCFKCDIETFRRYSSLYIRYKQIGTSFKKSILRDRFVKKNRDCETSITVKKTRPLDS